MSAEPRLNAVIVVSVLNSMGVLITVNQRIHGHYVTSGFRKSPDDGNILLMQAMLALTAPYMGEGTATPEA
jgi:hypothetical protein